MSIFVFSVEGRVQGFTYTFTNRAIYTQPWDQYLTNETEKNRKSKVAFEVLKGSLVFIQHVDTGSLCISFFFNIECVGGHLCDTTQV